MTSYHIACAVSIWQVSTLHQFRSWISAIIEIPHQATWKHAWISFRKCDKHRTRNIFIYALRAPRERLYHHHHQQSQAWSLDNKQFADQQTLHKSPKKKPIKKKIKKWNIKTLQYYIFFDLFLICFYLKIFKNILEISVTPF